MKYEVAQNQPQEDKAIIARINAGETVLGAFLRGTGKIYMQMPIHVVTLTTGDDKGKLALSAGAHTHNGHIQETFSRLICEWQPVCERANEINRGALMTDLEKAEMKRRRLIGTIASDLEMQAKCLIIYQDRIDELLKYTAYQHALADTGWGTELLDRVEEKDPNWSSNRYDSSMKMHTGQLAYTHKLIKKLTDKQAQLAK